jgi:hypothetical protein
MLRERQVVSFWSLFLTAFTLKSSAWLHCTFYVKKPVKFGIRPDPEWRRVSLIAQKRIFMLSILRTTVTRLKLVAFRKGGCCYSVFFLIILYVFWGLLLTAIPSSV